MFLPILLPRESKGNLSLGKKVKVKEAYKDKKKNSSSAFNLLPLSCKKSKQQHIIPKEITILKRISTGQHEIQKTRITLFERPDQSCALFPNYSLHYPDNLRRNTPSTTTETKVTKSFCFFLDHKKDLYFIFWSQNPFYELYHLDCLMSQVSSLAS